MKAAFAEVKAAGLIPTKRKFSQPASNVPPWTPAQPQQHSAGLNRRRSSGGERGKGRGGGRQGGRPSWQWHTDKHELALSDLLAKNSDESTTRGWATLAALEKEGTVRAAHYNQLLKACYSSAQVRDIINERMKDAGVEPNSATYARLVRMLLQEGEAAEAARVVQEEVPARGLEWPEHKMEAWLSKHSMETYRRFSLRNWLAHGGEAANAGAWELFEKLEARGAATLAHYNVMLEYGCYGSDQTRELIRVRMQAAGVAPDAASYV